MMRFLIGTLCNILFGFAAAYIGTHSWEVIQFAMGLKDVHYLSIFDTQSIIIMLGLINSIVGTIIFSRGTSKSEASRLCLIRNGNIALKEKSSFEKWMIRIIGSNDPRDTEEYISESFHDKLYGLLLLALGFFAQVVGIIYEFFVS